jgi:hypothetical protein
VPRTATGSTPDDAELLALMGLDAGKWAVASDSIRVSRWQVASRDGEPQWLEAYRGQVWSAEYANDHDVPTYPDPKEAS